VQRAARMNLGSGILQALIKPAVQDLKASTDKNSQEQAKILDSTGYCARADPGSLDFVADYV
jgi:hypothetical protein